jgi:hypothetical protein
MSPIYRTYVLLHIHAYPCICAYMCAPCVPAGPPGTWYRPAVSSATEPPASPQRPSERPTGPSGRRAHARTYDSEGVRGWGLDSDAWDHGTCDQVSSSQTVTTGSREREFTDKKRNVQLHGSLLLVAYLLFEESFKNRTLVRRHLGVYVLPLSQAPTLIGGGSLGKYVSKRISSDLGNP